MRELRDSMEDTPYDANRALDMLRAMFNKAEEWELKPLNSNPAVKIERYPEKSRIRALNEVEQIRLGATISEMKREGALTPHLAGLFRLLMLAGSRLGEIRTLRWSYVDFDAKRITLHEHKTDRYGPKTIMITPEVRTVLKQMESIAEPDAAHVFPGLSPGNPISNVQYPWRKVRRCADLDDVRIHDLRHTYLSTGADMDIPVKKLGKMAGHASIATTTKYVHYDNAELRRPAAQISGKIGKNVGLD